MGYVQGFAPCFRCGQVFGFNPTRVPSIRIEGVRRPVCEACVIAVNPKRVANGLDPIVPLPGAYDPAPESELDVDE